MVFSSSPSPEDVISSLVLVVALEWDLERAVSVEGLEGQEADSAV